MSKNVIKDTFGKRLISLRKGKKLTQSQLAENADVSFESYKKWESGNDNITAKNLKNLAEYFNVTTDYLLSRTDYLTPNDEAIAEWMGLSVEAAKSLYQCRNTYIPRIVSKMVELAPQNFGLLFSAINDYFNLHQKPEEDIIFYRLAVEQNCTVQLSNLLRKVLEIKSPEYQKQKEKVFEERAKADAEVQKRYDADNPHKKTGSISEVIPKGYRPISEDLFQFFMEMIDSDPQMKKKYLEQFLPDKDCPEA